MVADSSSARADKSVAFWLEVCVRYNTSSTTSLMRPEQPLSVSRTFVMGLTTDFKIRETVIRTRIMQIRVDALFVIMELR